jgi:hypothetical protein
MELSSFLINFSNHFFARFFHWIYFSIFFILHLLTDHVRHRIQVSLPSSHSLSYIRLKLIILMAKLGKKGNEIEMKLHETFSSFVHSLTHSLAHTSSLMIICVCVWVTAREGGEWSHKISHPSFRFLSTYSSINNNVLFQSVIFDICVI